MSVLEMSVFFLAAMAGVVVIGGLTAMQLSYKRKRKTLT